MNRAPPPRPIRSMIPWSRKLRKPLFEILRQSFFTLDGVKHKNVPGAEGGQAFCADFLKKSEEGRILNLPLAGSPQPGNRPFL